MLNVTAIRGSNQYAAAHYFAAADDYYTKEHAGEWQGKGAQALGLTGAIEQAQFARLLNGQLPNGDRIHRTFDVGQHKKRMGLDLTFSAPKSVSMQALVAGDLAVLAAHDRAVTRALQQVEQLAEARRKVRGKSFRERTANMVIAKFRHEMSRAKDPQLHTHAVVLNMTQRADGAWRALSNEDIFRVQHQVDALYKAELAKELQVLGYAIRLVDDLGNFELAHISRTQIEAFSARSRVIEEALANAGKTRATATTLEKQVIALATRARKDESDRTLVKQYWVEKSGALSIDYGLRSQLCGTIYSDGSRGQSTAVGDAVAIKSLPTGITPAQAVVQYAINHLSEREAVVRETLLMATALRRAVGLAGPDEVHAEIKRLVKQGALIDAPPVYRIAGSKDGLELSAAGWRNHLQELKSWNHRQAQQYVSHAIQRGSLVPLEKRYTTQKALALEKAILAIEATGRGVVEPLLKARTVKASLDRCALTAGQRLAVESIVSSRNRFIGIQGDAGTGKTHTLNQAVRLIQQAAHPTNCYDTIALAPYGNQVKALRNEGLQAHTLASFLRSKDKPIDEKTIIVLDESAVVGTRQMAHIMRIVEKAGARMVLLGDTKQTEAIEAGKPFAQLQQNGMLTTRISEIQRQKDPELKTAVEFAAEGLASHSLALIRHVEEQPDASERHQAIVDDYMRLSEPDRRETLVVAGTNQGRREINRMVRESLELSGKGREFDTLTRVDMTQAQRRFAPSFQKGMAIQPEKDYPKAGLARGETYRVKEALPGNTLVLQRLDGTLTSINPRKLTKLSVYHPERTELSIGDTVRINRNDARRDLTNGDRMRVAGITGGLLRLTSIEQRNGQPVRTLELLADKPLHLEHAYASTVHSAQGLTNDRALIALDTRSRTTSLNLYYVAISRARLEARVYTDSVKGLPNAIARRFEKSTALAIQRERQLQRGNASTLSTKLADGLRQAELQRCPPKPMAYGHVD